MKHDRVGAPFDRLVASFLRMDGVSLGTMMGFPCLRRRGVFFAMADHRTGDLIVKLPEARVQALVREGGGTPFAPAGRSFREWVHISKKNAHLWKDIMDEALVFASS